MNTKLSARLIEQSAPAKKLSALVVLTQDGKRLAARIHIRYSDQRVQVDIYNYEEQKFATGCAHGGGYDRLTAALAASGVTFAGEPFYDHGHVPDGARAGIDDLARRGFLAYQAL